MPLMPSHKNKQLLCLYTFYGDFTECKLAMLRGSRALSNFYGQSRPFVLNLFSEDSATQEARRNEFYYYIVTLQVNYHAQLRAWNFNPPALPYDISDEGRDITEAEIMSAHRLLCDCDGTPAGDDAFDDYRHNATLPWEVPAKLEEYLYRGVAEINDAFNALERFRPHIEAGKLYLSVNQATAELMEFLTHMSRACKLRWSQEQPDSVKSEKIEKELEAGIRHLKRTTLDVRKSIIATAMKHHREWVDNTMVRAVLVDRAKEVRSAVDDAEKFSLYRSIANNLLSKAASRS